MLISNVLHLGFLYFYSEELGCYFLTYETVIYFVCRKDKNIDSDWGLLSASRTVAHKILYFSFISLIKLNLSGQSQRGLSGHVTLAWSPMENAGSLC